jgi:uncharacterized protein (DUF58 family)
MLAQQDTAKKDYLVPQTLAQLGRLELRAKMIVEGMMSGAQRSPYRGGAVEFAAHRQYVPGDDTRRLDWRVYGRTDKLYIREHQQETNLDVVLFVDASSSMRYGTLPVRQRPGGGAEGSDAPRWTKYDHATAISAALAYLALRQHDRVGLAVFADGVRLLLDRSSTPDQWRQVITALSEEPAQKETDFARATEQVLSRIRNRALFVIVSDCFDSAERIGKALARFRHRGHDVILLNSLDREEMRFTLAAPAPFVGLEGEGELRVDPRALRQAYLVRLKQHVETVARSTMSLGFDYHRLDTHESVGPPLAHVLARRSAIIKRGVRG